FASCLASLAFLVENDKHNNSKDHSLLTTVLVVLLIYTSVLVFLVLGGYYGHLKRQNRTKMEYLVAYTQSTNTASGV
ncbi:hypothetical protein PFISCL1PPCAC_4149, partial [Pristionchus fissidentatus]